MVRWTLFLQEFDFDVQYIPGKDNGAADTLSRSGAFRFISPCSRPLYVAAIREKKCSLTKKRIVEAQSIDPAVDEIRRKCAEEEVDRYKIMDEMLYHVARDGTLRLYSTDSLVSEVIDFGRTGYYADSVEELPELVHRALLLDRSAIRERSAARFDHRVMTDNYLEAYYAVLDGAS